MVKNIYEVWVRFTRMKMHGYDQVGRVMWNYT
jgi:hypothetical protein